jgi:hypothetical protein
MILGRVATVPLYSSVSPLSLAFSFELLVIKRESNEPPSGLYLNSESGNLYCRPTFRNESGNSNSVYLQHSRGTPSFPSVEPLSFLSLSADRPIHEYVWHLLSHLYASTFHPPLVVALFKHKTRATSCLYFLLAKGRRGINKWGTGAPSDGSWWRRSMVPKMESSLLLGHWRAFTPASVAADEGIYLIIWKNIVRWLAARTRGVVWRLPSRGLNELRCR